jgi:hypothetical protein
MSNAERGAAEPTSARIFIPHSAFIIQHFRRSAMPDHDDNQPLDPKKTLSEISHLFLSSIRDKQTNGAARPLRKGPGQPPQPPAQPVQPAPRTDQSIDLTPEEFAQVYGGGAGNGPHAAEAAPAEPDARPVAPVCAVIGSHLNGKQFDRVKEYARHLAGQVGRVGLIELDASEFRLMCFEPGATPADLADAAAASAATPECYDPRQIAEAVEELGCDVRRWVVLLTTPRVPEARALLRQVDHWVLLTTCDHDGVVSAYRSLKGLVEPSHRPRVTLALLDPPAEPEMVAVYRKLSGVCQQFLGLRLDAEPAVRRSFRIAEHLVLLCRPTRDKARMANPPQWEILAEFLAKAKQAPAGHEEDVVVETIERADEQGVELVEENAHDVAAPEPPVQPPLAQSAPTLAPAPIPPPVHPAPPGAYQEVVELNDQGGTAEAVLSAVLRQNHGAYVECPVRAPMCGEARLAVSRDRGIVIFAVAREGLGELRAIGQAYKWVRENRTLLGMALPQFAIDTNQTPRLRLLVDQSDLSADALQPVLQSEYVTVQSYRKLRWGDRTGLLLEAA